MTKDEALKKMQAVKSYMTSGNPIWSVTEMGEAFDMAIEALSAQPETAKRIVGCTRDGMTMWYQCDMCHEPVDLKDAFCSGCGRRFVDE